MGTTACRRVCLITSVNPALDVRIFHKQAKALAEAGYEVTLIAPHSQTAFLDGIHILALPKPKNRFSRWINTLRILRLACSHHAQIYHLHNPELILVGVWLKVFKRGAKVFYDVHEDYRTDILDKAWLPSWCRRAVALLFDRLEKQVTKTFDGVIAATDYIQSRFTTHRVVAVRNYPPLTWLQQASQQPRKMTDPPTLIYVGSLTPIRGIREIIEAVGLLKTPARLVLIGAWGDKRFETALNVSKFFPKVEYLGTLPWEKVLPHLLAAAVGLICFHPTRAHVNAGPNKLFEYMAAGIPIIASDFAAWRPLINGCGLLVDPLNPREIAQAADYLLTHPEEAEKMGKEGQRLVLERFSWEREKQTLLEFYAQHTN